MIGRLKEKEVLLDAVASGYSEFVAVYGRRRVGKTFLVRETFNYKFTFQHSGIKNGGKSVQLARFRKSLVTYGLTDCPVLKDWFDAFDALRNLIDGSSPLPELSPARCFLKGLRCLAQAESTAVPVFDV